MTLWDDFGSSDIPQEIVAELQALGDNNDDAAWRTGELVEMMFQQLEAEGVEVPRMRMYAAVGAWRRAAAETVRMYHHVAIKVPQDVRRRHTELSFHQFKALVPHANDALAQEIGGWDGLIDLWQEHAALIGVNPGSVDGIRAWLGNKGQGERGALNRWFRMVRSMEAVIREQVTPAALVAVLSNTMRRLRELAKGEWRL